MMLWIILGFVTFVVIPVILAVQLGRTVRGSSVERLSHFSYPVSSANHDSTFDAIGAIDQLEHVGFAKTGAVKWHMPAEQVTFSVLHDSELRTYAVVTPQHLTLISDYNGKSLLTASSGQAAPAAFELSQAFPDASPSELVQQHRDAIARVHSLTGHLARQLDTNEIVALHIRAEMHGVKTFSVGAEIKAAISNTVRDGARNPLARHADEAIRRWLTSNASYLLG